jgi:hypothetical protein
VVELDVGSALVPADVPEVVPALDDPAGVLELVAGIDEPELEPELLELDPLEDPDEEPDDVEPEPVFDDASGSVYCWSPAEGPEASARPGAATANSTSRSSNPISARVARTGASMATNAAGRVRLTQS